MSEKHDRLREARELAGYESTADAARALGMRPSTYAAHENGQNGFKEDKAAEYGRKFGVKPAWLLIGDPADAPDKSAAVRSHGPEEVSRATLPPPNASPPVPVTFPNVTIGMYGAAAGGGLDDGKFILNGNRVMDVLCPPMLIGVQGAYGVFVHGNSMKPRYREGEAVFVNPHLPIRQEDYAVVQIAGEFEGDDSSGFVKQFVSRNSRELVMAQHQPPEAAEPEPYSENRFLLRFPRERVIAVHRIVWAGEV